MGAGTRTQSNYNPIMRRFLRRPPPQSDTSPNFGAVGGPRYQRSQANQAVCAPLCALLVRLIGFVVAVVNDDDDRRRDGAALARPAAMHSAEG
jgi:hypothetical protein